MKKLILVIALLLSSFSVFSQKEYAKVLPDDIAVVDSLKSLYSSDEYKIVVYQPGGYEWICISSVVFIEVNNAVDYWLILFDKENPCDDDSYYSYIVKYGGELKDNLIFSYPFYLNTGITKSEWDEEEESYPTPSRIDDSIYYIDASISFYFNDDTGPISRENENYKYRREWLSVIKESLRPIFKEYCADYWSFFEDSLED